MRWTKASTLDFAGAKVKLLYWVQQKPRFEAFSNVGYLHIIILNNTVLGNKDYVPILQMSTLRPRFRDLAESLSIEPLSAH